MVVSTTCSRRLRRSAGKLMLPSNATRRAVYEYWPPDMIPGAPKCPLGSGQITGKVNRTNEAVGELIQLNASATNPAERTESLSICCTMAHCQKRENLPRA